MGNKVDLFEFVEAGLLQNVDVVIETAVFDFFDYQGSRDPATALRLDLREVNDESGAVQSQYFTVGGSKDGNHTFVPSEDGQFLEDTGGRTKLGKRSNYNVLIDSLIAEGFDVKKGATEGIGVLDGTVGHVVRTKSLNKGDDGEERENLTFSKIHSWGYEDKKKGAGGARKKAAKKASAKTRAKEEEEETSGGDEGDEETSTIAATLAMEILGEEGELAISKLQLMVYKQAVDYDTDVRRAIKDHAGDVAWLGEQGFTVEGKKVSL